MNNKLVVKLVFLPFFLAGLNSYGQNIPQFTQFVFNNFYNNAGATGISGKTTFQANIRSQYSGYTNDLYPGGENLSTVFSADLPFNKLKGGLGVYFSNNNYSQIQSKTEAVINYSYHKRLNSNLLGFGVGVGLNSLNLKYENYIARDSEDPLVSNLNQTLISPNLNAGVFLQNPIYQIGLSIKNITEAKYKKGTLGPITEGRTIYLNGKYDLGLGYNLDISPMLMLKSDLQQISTELGVLVNYKQNLWGGVNYRWSDAIGFMAGTSILQNKIKIGYAFDYVLIGVNAKSNTSHEVLLRYALNPIKIGKKTIIRTPRYNF